MRLITSADSRLENEPLSLIATDGRTVVLSPGAAITCAIVH
jgi:hypothetical protein